MQSIRCKQDRIRRACTLCNMAETNANRTALWHAGDSTDTQHRIGGKWARLRARKDGIDVLLEQLVLLGLLCLVVLLRSRIRRCV